MEFQITHMDQMKNVIFIHVILKDNIVISVIVLFILVVKVLLVENGLKIKEYGIVRIVLGYMKQKQLIV